MAFETPRFEVIRDALLRDILAQAPDADIGPDSDHYVRAAANAAAIEGLYQHQAWIKRQIFPDTADSDYLQRHAGVRSLTKKAAVAAGGVARLTGAPGTSLPADSALTHRGSGESLKTTGDATVDEDGSVDITVVAVTLGASLNGLTGELTLSAPPLGIDAGATLASPLTGGVDEESDAELLDRLLELIRRPPAGGNKYDYRRWAMEVDGVSDAYVYPLRRGLGTVDIVITSAGGLPSPQTVDATQAHIDDQRPVTAKHSLVLVPTLSPAGVVVRIAIDTAVTTLAAATAQIEAALAQYFAALAPGDTAYKSRIEAIVSGIVGVVDREVVTPGANLVPDTEQAVEWVRLGQVSVEPMA